MPAGGHWGSFVAGVYVPSEGGVVSTAAGLYLDVSGSACLTFHICLYPMDQVG